MFILTHTNTHTHNHDNHLMSPRKNFKKQVWAKKKKHFKGENLWKETIQMTFLCLHVSLTSSSGFGGTLSSFLSEITLFYSFFSRSDQLFSSAIGCPSVHGSPRCLIDSDSPWRRPSSQQRLSCASCWAVDCWRCRGLWFSPDRNPHAWWPERWSSPPVRDRGEG